MIELYKGKEGEIAGVVYFIKEALPVYFVPTFILMYTYKLEI